MLALAAAEEVLVRFERGFRAAQRLAFARAQNAAQRRGDALRDLVLDGKDVGDRAVEPLRPALIAARHFHELHGDAQPVANPADAALEHGRDAELGTDRLDVRARRAELKRRAARGDPQAVHAREHVDELVGEAIAQPVLVPRRAHVRERQDGNRSTGRRASEGLRRGAGVLPDRLERKREIAGGLKALAGILGQTALDHAFERGRDLAVCGRARLLVQDGGKRLRDTSAAERADAVDHLEQRRANRKDVDALVRRLPANLFRRHVRGRADHLIGIRGHKSRRLRPGGRFRSKLRKPEVENLERAVPGDEQVLGL